MINSVGGAPHELFTFGSLLMCSLCVQPVQLEKAISNPDLRAGKVRQRSVASAENTEVAETEGDVIMMTTYNMTILSCLFA